MEESKEWLEEHPWLNDDFELDEVVRYSLDEIRVS